MTTETTRHGLRWTTGGLLVLGAVAFALAATVLSSTFEWPDIDRQWTVFGAYGAVTFSALSGLLLLVLLPDRPRAGSAAAAAPAAAASEARA